VNSDALLRDLDSNWEVLAEAIQTVMRKAGHTNPYEKLKELTRGASVDEKKMREFVTALELPDDDKQRLLDLTPASYIGLAAELVELVKK